MVIYSTNHVQLSTTDVKASRAFFVEGFGGKVILEIMEKDGVTPKGCMVKLAPDTVIEIQPPRFDGARCRSAWDALTLQMDDAHALIASLAAAGAEVTVEGDRAVVVGPERSRIELVEAAGEA